MDDHDLEQRLESPSAPRRFSKLREWFFRYAPAELVGTVAAYVGFFLMQKHTDSDIAAAYGGTLGENVGFYGVMIAREVSHDRRAAREKDQPYGLVATLKTAGKLVSEFGPAEALDSLVIRPGVMGLGARLLGQGVGVFAGKITADILFYVQTVTSYEIRKAIVRHNKPNPS